MPMKNVLVIFLFIGYSLFAQFELDTTLSIPVGPGTIYTHLHDTKLPLNVYVLEVDLTNPYVELETINSNDKMPDASRETVSAMSARNTRNGHRVAGSVNGDFFSYTPGNSLGMQVRKSEIVKSYGGSHGMYFSKSKIPGLGKPSYSGLLTANENSIPINAVNMLFSDIERWFPQLLDNRLVLYNNYFGASFNNGSNETKVIIEPIEEWTINNTPTKCEVKQIITGASASITGEEYVLVCVGSGADFVNANVNVGDTLEIKNEVRDDYTGSKLPNLTELLGGYPRIVVNGEEYVDEGIAEMNASLTPGNRDPRTGMGYSEDGSKLYLVAADGRHSSSAGVTMYELAEFLISIGVYSGTNLDGGGSTTMVVDNGVVNRPSGGTERRVINAMQVISTAPTGDLSEVQLYPQRLIILPSETYQFNLFGWDDFQNPIDINQSQVSFSAENWIGNIDDNGLFTAGSEKASGYVIASYNGFVDSVFVLIKKDGEFTRLELSPRYGRLYFREQIQFTVKGLDEFGDEFPIETNNVVYSKSHNFGALSQTGKFTAGELHDSGYVYAEYEGAIDSVKIVVKGTLGIEIAPDNVGTDTLRTIHFKVRSADTDGLKHVINPNVFSWSLTNPSVGVIDNKGSFTGQQQGKTNVIAEFNGIYDTTRLSVFPVEAIKIIEPFEEIGNWQFEGENINIALSTLSLSNSIYSEGGKSLEFNYSYTGNPSSNYFFSLKNDIQIEGTPDSIKFDMQSDGLGHLVRIFFIDADGEFFEIRPRDRAKDSFAFQTITGLFSEIRAVNFGQLNYPLRLAEIEVKIGGPKESNITYNSSIYFDNLKVFYPHVTTGVEIVNQIPNEFSLSQNYPNPFNPNTKIKYAIPTSALGTRNSEHVTLHIYDILGNEVATLVNKQQAPGYYEISFNATHLATGLYIYRLIAGDFVKTRKMMLIK